MEEHHFVRIAGAVFVIFCSLGVAVRAEVFNSEHYRLEVTTVVNGLRSPWGLAFLPDGRMIVTERAGGIRIVTPAGKMFPRLSGMPEVYARNQGGMLDVAVDPEFSGNKFIYFSFAEPGVRGAGTAVARARLVVADRDCIGAQHKLHSPFHAVCVSIKFQTFDLFSEL